MDLPKFICKRVISMTLVKSINLVVIFRFVVISNSFFSGGVSHTVLSASGHPCHAAGATKSEEQLQDKKRWLRKNLRLENCLTTLHFPSQPNGWNVLQGNWGRPLLLRVFLH
jgi:hypothetical protein